jgi:hypothetical protein
MRKTPFLPILVIFAFLVNSLGPIPSSQAQAALPEGGDFHLPSPGVRVGLSPDYNPPILKGIKIDPGNPFQFDFILDQGDSAHVIPAEAGIQYQEQLKQEASHLIKYFLASLTIPEKDLWVNLSPYEKNRIIPQSFGQTEMGRDLLAEDYMLKQITASLIYPEERIGRMFWKRIYEKAGKKFGTTNIPVNTFNKVWIVPQKAVVYENVKAGTAYVVESKLKVMLEEDYLSLQKHQGPPSAPLDNFHSVGADIVRDIVIPELTREVNNDKNFAQLRQVYNSLILAAWYKKKIKDSILAQVYSDRNKTAGIQYGRSVIFKGPPSSAQNDIELIYQRYIQAFKKGVFNYIKEETDPMTQETIPRKYFSGGVNMAMSGVTNLKAGFAMEFVHQFAGNVPVKNEVEVKANLAMFSESSLEKYLLQVQEAYQRINAPNARKDQGAPAVLSHVEKFKWLNDHLLAEKSKLYAYATMFMGIPVPFWPDDMTAEDMDGQGRIINPKIKDEIRVLMAAKSGAGERVLLTDSADQRDFEERLQSAKTGFAQEVTALKMDLDDFLNNPPEGMDKKYWSERVNHILVANLPAFPSAVNGMSKPQMIDFIDSLDTCVKLLYSLSHPEGVLSKIGEARTIREWAQGYVENYSNEMKRLLALGDGGKSLAEYEKGQGSIRALAYLIAYDEGGYFEIVKGLALQLEPKVKEHALKLGIFKDEIYISEGLILASGIENGLGKIAGTNTIANEVLNLKNEMPQKADEIAAEKIFKGPHVTGEADLKNNLGVMINRLNNAATLLNVAVQSNEKFDWQEERELLMENARTVFAVQFILKRDYARNHAMRGIIDDRIVFNGKVPRRPGDLAMSIQPADSVKIMEKIFREYSNETGGNSLDPVKDDLHRLLLKHISGSVNLTDMMLDVRRVYKQNTALELETGKFTEAVVIALMDALGLTEVQAGEIWKVNDDLIRDHFEFKEADINLAAGRIEDKLKEYEVHLDEKDLKLLAQDLIELNNIKYNGPYSRFIRGGEDEAMSVNIDHAMGKVKSENGGIDLTLAKMNLLTNIDSRFRGNDNAGIKFHLDPAMLQQLQNAAGFVPVIISVKPLKDLNSFLGIVNQTT